MKTSHVLMDSVEFIKPFEGLHKVRKDGMIVPYLCPAGHWTIGWGHLCSKAHPPTTERVCTLYLYSDVIKTLNQVLAVSPKLIDTPNSLVAIVSFTFNLGIGAYRSSTLRRKVDAQDWEAARKQIKRWVHGDGKKLPGLVIRRDAEANLLGT